MSKEELPLITKYRPENFKQVIGQPLTVRSLREAVTSHSSHAFLFGGPAGTGKALALDTPIPTPTGWATMGSIREGDFVFDVFGKPTRVIGTSLVMLGHYCYQVTFSDNSKIVADAEHLWETFPLNVRDSITRKKVQKSKRVRLKDNDKPKIVSTEYISCTLKIGDRVNHAVRVAKPIDLPEQELSIHPYVFGCWLGDGTTAAGSLTVGDADAVDMEQSLAVVGQSIKRLTFPMRAQRWTLTGIQSGLRSLGVLGNKCIPQQYLRASISQRIALLKGIMDTDGWVSETGNCEVTSTNRILAYDIYELICSLGCRTSITVGNSQLNGVVYGPNYRIRFTPNFDVFTLPRKLARQRPATVRCNYRYIISVDEVKSVPVKCISVESASKLYLVGHSFIPTHNTTLARLTASALSADAKPDLIEINGADNTGIDAMRDLLLQLRYTSLKADVKAIIVDEAHRLSPQAFDVILKPVEEPPAWVYWFFCTTNSGKVPKTIRTRCLIYELSEVSNTDLFDFLCGIDEKEGLGLPDEVIHTCVKAAGGSPRQALVNYAKCTKCKTRKEAAELLHSVVVGADAPAVKLAQELARGRFKWGELQPILDSLKETNPEEIRQTVRGYITKVILGTKDQNKAQVLFKILEAFAEPFQSQDQFTPVVTSICKILFWE